MRARYRRQNRDEPLLEAEYLSKAEQGRAIAETIKFSRWRGLATRYSGAFMSACKH